MICVFSAWTRQDEFNTCGERILNPSYCVTHHEDNGDYSIELHQPITPDDDCYQFLKPYNIIKNSKGQLFPIYYVQRKLVNGIPTVIAKAKHIFYILNGRITYNVQSQGADGWSCWTIMDDIYNHADADIIKTDELIYYDFTHTSDIGDWRHYSADKISVAKAVFEAVDTWSGHLYRDNFHYSVNRVMQNSQENAFHALHGWNVTDIVETIDYSNKITEIRATDNMGNSYGNSITPHWGGLFPYQMRAQLEFSYDQQSSLGTDANAYFATYGLALDGNPRAAYEISNIASLSNSSRSTGWDAFERVNVGDSGWIDSDVLGISTYQTVVSTDYNDLTEKNDNVKIANFEISKNLHPGRFNTRICGYNAETKRIANLERQRNFFEYVE